MEHIHTKGDILLLFRAKIPPLRSIARHTIVMKSTDQFPSNIKDANGTLGRKIDKLDSPLTSTFNLTSRFERRCAYVGIWNTAMRSSSLRARSESICDERRVNWKKSPVANGFLLLT